MIELLRKFRIGTVVLAVAVALAAALTVLPARWLLWLMPSDAPITVVEASGTLWSGTAWIALGSPQSRRMLTEPVQWRWNGASVDVRHPYLRGPVKLSFGLGGVSVSAQQATLPAAVLAGMGTPWNTMSPGGQIDVQWRAFTPGTLAQGTLADIYWRNASAAMAPIAPIGDYHVRLEGSGRNIKITLSTDKGALQLTGQGEWTGRRLNFQGRAKASDKASDTEQAALTGLLTAIGPERDDGHAFGTGKL
ncbi:general secretion pathway protein N [Bordetella ansorpii]|uniref:Type II secretion system protein N n=1 Tax=Bordetella ansorpii TaxID=288768 RepID=A0A157Q123_9BORD|nr:type II secretion system protein N [Bordetella ansorpii]SAI39572.1 general secretion pathway protein N [Bordetella ansorpii]